ncbi:uncharacterized protein LOC106055287 [Biomphalaria glabrata]|uniref:Uncharacterized protein LOC106055287 n=1 Tax=Biomphalaria glabrata TaxID=6526 RepID=A0A9W2YXX4_BIOGL|nr:uncharacterized protein LOC106055287 [Biomphalaria glabrata]
MDSKKFLFEAELVNYVKIDVVLPDGQKEKATLNFENTIKQEKEMILERNKLRYADIYVMVLMGAHNSRTILDDNRLVSHYANLLATGSEPYLEIAKNSSELERPPRPVNPAQFGITLK